MPPKNKYTDPKLREEVKEDIKASDKGGAPGQWSARKAQMMASEYKKRGGDYTTDKETGQDESQKNLQKWGEEDWQTKDGSGSAKKEDGSRKRYLPKKAWDKMTEEEKQDTEEKKEEGGKDGKQFVGNTDKAKQKRKEVNEEEAEEFENGRKANGNKTGENAPKKRGRPAKKDSEKKGNASTKKQDAEVNDDQQDGGPTASTQEEEDSTPVEKKSEKTAKTGEKRGRPKKETEKADPKKQKTGGGKTMGSKHDSTEEPAQQGSADRLPKKGQRISWKAMPGWVHGELQEVVTSSKKVDGKQVKGSDSDPRFVLKADSGKICVHKPEACFYD